jgi:hypothetical protein
MNVGRYLRGEDRHVGTARVTKPKVAEMNERIKQLALQAGLDLIHDKFMTAPQEKFAELILIEVTDILSTYRGKMVFEDGAEYNYEHPIIAIRKHFGVEE